MIARRGSLPATLLMTTNLFDSQACNCLEDAVDLLDLVDDQRPDRVDIRRFADSDDVVFASDRVGRSDASDAFHLLGDLERSTRRRVDQDISLHSPTPKSSRRKTESA